VSTELSLEDILLGPYRRHGGNRIADGIGVFLDGTLADSHERIEGKLLADGRRNGRLTGLALPRRPVQLVDDGAVRRFDGRCELEVGDGILVSAEDLRVGRKRRQDLDERAVHLAGRALKEAAASADEERVACEDDGWFVFCIRRLYADEQVKYPNRYEIVLTIK